MTEAEWLTCADPTTMLHFLRTKLSDRKLRLLTVAACQPVLHLMPERCRLVSGVLELYADGLISEGKYQKAWSEADAACRMCAQDPPDATTYAAESVMISFPPTATSVEYALSTAAIALGCHSATSAAEQDYDAVEEAGRLRAAGEQACLIRDIFPFRPVTVSPTSLTSDVVALATGIYQDRAFDRLPILADALQDAGCDSDDMLDHLRGDGPHVLGCWALDLVLGKS